MKCTLEVGCVFVCVSVSIFAKAQSEYKSGLILPLCMFLLKCFGRIFEGGGECEMRTCVGTMYVKHPKATCSNHNIVYGRRTFWTLANCMRKWSQETAINREHGSRLQ